MADSAGWQNEPFASSLSLVFGRKHEENMKKTKEQLRRNHPLCLYSRAIFSLILFRLTNAYTIHVEQIKAICQMNLSPGKVKRSINFCSE